MDEAELRALLASGESLTTEFKSAVRKQDLSDNDIVEAAVCLANAQGGTLILGVNDDGIVSGCAPRHGGTTDAGNLEALIAGRTEPPLLCEVAVRILDAHDVVVVRVPNSAQPVQTSKGSFPRRRLNVHGIPQCESMTAADIRSATFASGEVDFATMPATGATLKDLDEAEFERFRKAVATKDPEARLATLDAESMLKGLDLARLGSDGELSISLGAILLFGRKETVHRFFPQHEVLFQVYSGTKLQRNEILDGPLFAIIEALRNLLDSAITQEEFTMGLFRLTVPSVPPRAAREAVLNALAHRDYFERGAVRIEFKRDAFSVESPGPLPRGVTVENILDSSVPRSKAVASALFRAGFVERAGTGVDIMFEESLSLGHPKPSYARSDEHRVVVDFPLGNADLAIARYVRERRNTSNVELDLVDLQVLRSVKEHGDVSLAELEQEVITQGASLVPSMTRMIEAGIVEPRGTGRGRRYHLSADFYRTAGEPAAYTNVRGLNREEMRERVLGRVAVQGSVARGEIAELCHISPAQSRALLKAMVDDGLLVMTGEKRNARYGTAL